MRPRSASCSVDSPQSGRAPAAATSYLDTRSRHWGCSANRSATMRLTRGRVRLASARVKNFGGTRLIIYAEMQRLDAQTHSGEQEGVNRTSFSLKLFTAARLCV